MTSLFDFSYASQTPKRPEATYLMRERRQSPASSGTSAAIRSAPNTSANVIPAFTGDRPSFNSAR